MGPVGVMAKAALPWRPMRLARLPPARRIHCRHVAHQVTATEPAQQVSTHTLLDDDEVLESVSIRGVRRYDGTGGSTLASYASCASCAAPRSSARLLPRRSSKCRPLPVALDTP